MKDRQLNKWIAFLSPMFEGWYDFDIAGEVRMDACAHGLPMFEGWGWPRIAGGHNLRRSTSGDVPTIADPIIGTAEGPVATIKTNWLVGHAVSSRYIYRLTAIGGGGVEDDGRTAILEVATDGAGALAGLLPNRVMDLQATPQINGSFVLRWTYSSAGQAAAPKYFRVYSDSGTGTVDYATPIGSVTYAAGVPVYALTTGVLAGAGDTFVQFVVRSESTTGARERNEMIVTARGRSTAPYTTLATIGQAEVSQAMTIPDAVAL